MLTRTLTIIVLMALVGCGNKAGQTTESEATIELNDGDSTIDYRDVIAVDGWIELSNEDAAMMSIVGKLMAEADRFYVLDRMKASVLVFDKDGGFLCAIGKKGNGPGEYSSVYDYAVNADRKEVALLSGNSEVYVYGLDGEFKRHQKLADSEITGIEYCSDKYFATTSYSAYPVSGQENYLLYRFDADFNCEARWLPYQQPSQTAFTPIVIGLRRVANEIYYIDNMHMRIIKLPRELADKPADIIRFDTPDPMPIEYYKSTSDFLTKQREYDWIMDVVLTKDTLLTASVGPKGYGVSINKWSGVRVKSGLYRGMTISGSLGTDGYLYTLVMPDEYLGSWKSRDVIHPAQDPTENSNALILKWHIAK